uniref:MPN domain-containing protein n=1 Tax=Kalanchoe fedtschenkoi TaxID=63787 RepID=A0A7N0UH12_KALFE
MTAPPRPINLSAAARKVEVDNRMPLHFYYRIADNLLKQAGIYRNEKNVVDLYILLLRYSSLVSETIPAHRDYQISFPHKRLLHKKNMFNILDELESLKPAAQRQIEEMNIAYERAQQQKLDARKTPAYRASSPSLEWPPTDTDAFNSGAASMSLQPKQKYISDHAQMSMYSNNQLDNRMQMLSLNRPPPRKETLSRHSILGPNGLSGSVWSPPKADCKVKYPSSSELIMNDNISLIEAVPYDRDDGKSKGNSMESVLALDDGRWATPQNEPRPQINETEDEDFFQLVRQPSPPPILAQINQEHSPIHPSKVADPRPGQAKFSLDGSPSSSSYQHLHIPVKMMDDFLRLAQENTRKNLETCGVLAGSLKNKVFHITTLIIPKQESTSDSCQTLNEEDIFEVQDRLSLFPLGWIHTHPSQTCFMSSVDLHTHYSYQIMLPEAIAIVMAPTDTSSPHGIFHLSDPSGVNVIRNCQQRGFHPHEEAPDGNPIYEHCSHVYLNERMKFDVVDLR